MTPKYPKDPLGRHPGLTTIRDRLRQQLVAGRAQAALTIKAGKSQRDAVCAERAARQEKRKVTLKRLNTTEEAVEAAKVAAAKIKAP